MVAGLHCADAAGLPVDGDSPLLQLPQEIRLLIFSLCRSGRRLIVSAAISDQSPVFNYGNSGCRKLLQVCQQFRIEAELVRKASYSLHFDGRGAFCQFLDSKWSVCPRSNRRYIGSALGLLISENCLNSIHTLKIAPGTTEVGYLHLAKVSTWLPSLVRLELDLTKETMWAYSRIPNITQEQIIAKEINWRLGTMFGVDTSNLQRGQKWHLVVFAIFMLPEDPDGRSVCSIQKTVCRINVEYVLDDNGVHVKIVS